ncbi:2-phosphosulfolactate phosphatase [Clostridium sp.]|uniref:2-phosphosulfolactate phosphatase n=1 Tax=Clostridium sp. TaxID=1506 RepID=UPI003996AA31
MKIDVIVSADHIKEFLLKDKVIVIIDVLRATSVITTALYNGAKAVIPVLTVEEAFEKKKELLSLGKEVILGGERQALKIEGFDFTNSPLEYKSEEVKDKSIIFSTTNGTRALNSCSGGEVVLIASLLNGQAIAKELIRLNKDIVIVNSGTNGEFSMDDFICGGYIISEVVKEITCELTDISKVAKDFYENNKNLRIALKEAKHYEVLKALSLEEDIEYCLNQNIYDIVLKYENGIIKKYKINKLE